MLSKRLTILACSLITGIAVLLGAWAITGTKYAKPLNLNDVKYHQLRGASKKQVECLATNIYREAGYEPREGQLAVGMVTMNRLQSGNYADSVCGVVHQKSGNTYQFSWVGMRNLPAMNPNVYQNILELATMIYMNHTKMIDPTHGSTFYHADYIPDPGWGRNLTKSTKIGRHIFYTKKHNL